MNAQPALSVRNVSVSFTGTRALNDVSIDFARGRVTALLGMNGSGKSTLVKVLAGFHAPEPGASVLIRGADLAVPVDGGQAQQRGLRFVHQNLALVDDLSVADNIALAQGFGRCRTALSRIRRRQHVEQATVVLSRLGIEIDPERPVSDLSSTERMLVAIARAFDSDTEPEDTIVVLDEPTAYLPGNAVRQLLELLTAIREQGGTIIYITHRLDEVVAVADDVVVLRDGKLAEQRAVAGLAVSDLGALIVGRPTAEPAERQKTGHARRAVGARANGAETLLSVQNLAGARLRDISFELRRGEILGVTGLVGCGRSELIRLVSGVQQLTAGRLVLGGDGYAPRDPRSALARGVACVPADRHAGIVADMSLRMNVTLGDLSSVWRRGYLRRRDERSEIEALIDKYGIRPSRPELPLATFSGGNQQKAVFAKLTRLNPRLLAVDEPTQGIDISGKADVMDALHEFASEGGSVLLGSSDFQEVAGVCDRVLLLDRGRAVGIFPPESIEEHMLTALSTTASTSTNRISS